MMLLQQALMMTWEALLAYWPAVAVLVGVLVASWVFGRKGRACHRMSFGLALIAAAAAFFFLPMLFSAALEDMSYWVDWAFHIATVIAVFVYAYLVFLPLTRRSSK